MFTAALRSALWQNQHHNNKYLKKKKRRSQSRHPSWKFSVAEAEILYNITGFKEEKPRRSQGGIPL